MLLISPLDNSLGLRLCAMAEPNGLADRKLEFRTMLKRVADQFRPEDVESLAFIHHLPATEPRTALGALSWMERKGMFSHDNVDALVQLLDRISRCDIIYNCGVKEYQEQQWEPERLEPSEAQGGSGGTEGENRVDLNDSKVTDVNPQLLTDEQASTEPIPPLPDQADTHGPSSPHLVNSTQETPPGVTPADQDRREDAHSVSDPTCPPDNTDPLSSLSPQQKKKLLERIASDEHMRTELFSMVEQQQGSRSDLPHPLHHDVDTLKNINGATAVPVAGPNATASGLPDNPLPAPHVAVGPPVGGRPPEASADLPTGSSSVVAGASQAAAPKSPSPGHSLRDDPPQSSIQKDIISWKVKKSCLAKQISSQKDRPFSKQLKVRAVGARPVTLKFLLHACGIGHDKNNSASLEVLVAVNNARKYQPLKHMARVNLEITVQMDDGKEFLATRSVCRELSNFCIHDFLPHEIICNPEHKVQNIEIKAEAYLRYDSENPPVPGCVITDDGWVAPQSSMALQQH